jgi:hypothetical protein
MSDIATLEIEDAKRRLDRVKSGVERIWDDLVALYKGRAWLALGYSSWDALCDAELDGARIALPISERREVVAEMRSQGMSTRAIASAVGVSHMTIHTDLPAVNKFTPAAVVGLDGKRQPATKPKEIQPTDPLKNLPTDDIEALSNAIVVSPLTEVINHLDDIAQDAEHFALPRIIGDDHKPIPLSTPQRQQLEATAARLRATADHIDTYLRSNP